MKRLITICLLSLPFIVKPQAPGGITNGLKLWLKADYSTSLLTTGSLVEYWRYANDPTKQFRQGSFVPLADGRPLLMISQVNFSPAVVFNGTQTLFGPINGNAPLLYGDDDYALFAIWKSSNTSINGERIWSQWDCSPISGSEAAGISLTTISNGMQYTYGPQFEFYPYNQGLHIQYQPDEWILTQFNVLDQDVQDLELNNHTNALLPIITSTDPLGGNGRARRRLFTSSHTIGSCDGFTPFEGGLAELIIYERPIQGWEKARVLSYLATKYGFSLYNSDYVASDFNGISGTRYWESGSPWNLHVFGIGRDNGAGGSGMTVTQSNSIHTGSGDGTGQPGAGNIILAADPGQVDNLEFMMIGHNADPLSETGEDLPLTLNNSSLRLAREWKVKRTGDPGPVSLSFDLLGINLTGGRNDPIDFALLIDEDGDGNFRTGTYTLHVPTSITGGRLHFDNLQFEDNTVFTFITRLRFNTVLTQQTLPLQVHPQDGTFKLLWQCQWPDHYQYFEIQHSPNGVQFNTIQVLPAISTSHYSTIHQPAGSVRQYYRIRAIGKNGSPQLSAVVTASFLFQYPITLPSNVFKDQISFTLRLEKQSQFTVRLLNMNGTEIIKATHVAQPGQERVQLRPNHYLPQGYYLLQVNIEGALYTHKLIKVH